MPHLKFALAALGLAGLVLSLPEAAAQAPRSPGRVLLVVVNLKRPESDLALHELRASSGASSGSGTTATAPIPYCLRKTCRTRGRLLLILRGRSWTSAGSPSTGATSSSAATSPTSPSRPRRKARGAVRVRGARGHRHRRRQRDPQPRSRGQDPDRERARPRRRRLSPEVVTAPSHAPSPPRLTLRRGRRIRVSRSAPSRARAGEGA